MNDDEGSALRARVATAENANASLQAALKECADRLERCCRACGNDAETAASAVWKYRKLAPST